MPLKEELPVWRCLRGAVCLELSVWSCLFGAVCVELSVWGCLFVCSEGTEELKVSQASKSVPHTYETFADRSLFGFEAPRAF